MQAIRRPLDAEEWLSRTEEEIPVPITDVSPPSPTSRSLIAAAPCMNPKVGLALTSGSLDGWTGSHLVLALGAALLQRPVTPDRLTGQISEALMLARTLVHERQRLLALDELLDVGGQSDVAPLSAEREREPLWHH